ncbi:MAG: FkbM family methyltransferase [Clostridia bacterium]|nr:FkbM family methyltransferase [Clostridia bacterium]
MKRYFYDPARVSPASFLRGSGIPVYLYGMGNGAEKAFAYLRRCGLSPSGVFASDGYVRGQTFAGFPVLSLSDVAKKEPEGFAAIVSFGCSGAEARLLFARVEAAGGIVFVPDLPLFGEEWTDEAFLAEHEDEISRARSLFRDPLSLTLFDALLRCKRTETPADLFRAAAPQERLYALIEPDSVRKAVDGGAYRGDTAKEMIARFPSLRELYCFEPDPASFSRLQSLSSERVRLCFYPVGLSSRDDELPFSGGGNRGAHFGEGGKTLAKTCALDSLPEAAGCDYIKLDVEGCERDALLGARELIRRDRPALAVSVYHRAKDFFSLPLLIAELCPAYRFYLSRADVCPAWDVILTAVPNEKWKGDVSHE